LNDEQFRKLPTMGVVKINYYTALSDVAARAMRTECKKNSAGSFTDLKKGVKEAICAEVQRCLKLWGSAGRAAEVLAQCAPWTAVEQLIVHNVYRMDDVQLGRLMYESRALLSAIPGVREVFSGEALREDDKYKFCWMSTLAGYQQAKRKCKEGRGPIYVPRKQAKLWDKPASDEEIIKWAQNICDEALIRYEIFSADAIIYWAKYFWDIHSEEYNHVIDVIKSNFAIKQIELVSQYKKS